VGVLGPALLDGEAMDDVDAGRDVGAEGAEGAVGAGGAVGTWRLGGAGGDRAVLYLLQSVQNHVGGRSAALSLQLPQLPKSHGHRLLNILTEGQKDERTSQIYPSSSKQVRVDTLHPHLVLVFVQ